MAESFVKCYTKGTYYGIKADIIIPSNPIVTASGDYFEFYLGFADLVEGGLSYSPANGWHKFLNTGATPGGTTNYWRSDAMTNQPKAGDTVSIEIINCRTAQ